MDFLLTFGLPALVGIFIGVMSGLLGIGGGTVMVPVFRLAFGMSPIESTATSLFTIIPTSVSGAVSHLRNGSCVPALGLAAGIGGALTSPVGVWLAHLSPAWMVMLAAALIIGYSAVNMLRKAAKMKSTQAVRSAGGGVSDMGGRGASPAEHAEASGEGSEPRDSASEKTALPSRSNSHQGDRVKLSRRQLFIGAAIGLVAGLASGYVGVGGGFIMVPLMLSLVGIPMKKASGTSLIAVMILAIPGVVEQALMGTVDYAVGLSVAVGSIPGAMVGARLVRAVPERALRFIFGFFLIVAAAILFVNELGILG